MPSERTIDRILHRQGLLRARPRKRPRDSYKRFERPGPMQRWQMDIVGGLRLVSPVTGELREAKVVTAVDDHSRYRFGRHGTRNGEVLFDKICRRNGISHRLTASRS